MRGDAHEASGHHAAPREAKKRIDAFAAELLLPRAVVGRLPEEDLRAPGLPRAWIMACARARDERRVTPRPASGLTLGVLSGGESR